MDQKLVTVPKTKQSFTAEDFGFEERAGAATPTTTKVPLTTAIVDAIEMTAPAKGKGPFTAEDFGFEKGTEVVSRIDAKGKGPFIAEDFGFEKDTKVVSRIEQYPAAPSRTAPESATVSFREKEPAAVMPVSFARAAPSQLATVPTSSTHAAPPSREQQAKVSYAGTPREYQPEQPVIEEEDMETIYVNQVVAPEDFEYAFEYGPDLIRFSRDEIENMKSIGEPGTSAGLRLLDCSNIREGLVLLGYKPMSALKDYQNLKHAYFLYPDETVSF